MHFFASVVLVLVDTDFFLLLLTYIYFRYINNHSAKKETKLLDIKVDLGYKIIILLEIIVALIKVVSNESFCPLCFILL